MNLKAASHPSHPISPTSNAVKTISGIRPRTSIDPNKRHSAKYHWSLVFTNRHALKIVSMTKSVFMHAHFHSEATPDTSENKRSPPGILRASLPP
jgi:hypothetical protein